MKQMLIGFLSGVAGTGAIVALSAYLAVVNGWLPARGDVEPDKFETEIAHKALHAVLAREANYANPLKADTENLMGGVKVYQSNCAGCHGGPGNPSPAFAKGFKPGPTLFANGDDVTDDPDGYIYWKVNHGIKFTGMPAFNTMLSEKEMWQVTTFLKNQDKLPADVEKAWKEVK